MGATDDVEEDVVEEVVVVVEVDVEASVGALAVVVVVVVVLDELEVEVELVSVVVEEEDVVLVVEMELIAELEEVLDVPVFWYNPMRPEPPQSSRLLPVQAMLQSVCACLAALLSKVLPQ